ncbi:mannose-6-phosphate isomerase, class I [Bifidobacterium sp. 82T24]|uniref:mannose-6-phosphate isomerase, class I n=1 Tax=Bifidobacterium pluvialisilvae TaxID=2834436 RepID=UPI001C595C0B|nr:mannose-6-phosphate isomerase, class I [Bifidobacterium pluvialisilvae]MBW3087666.1 mannose-6-phosphate isomerase, class I [Bifidobacterium pluvialisilvae]
MLPMQPLLRRYAWGSACRLQSMFPRFHDVRGPLAELWFSGHTRFSSTVADDGRPMPLAEWIRRHPTAALGERASALWGPTLPYLMKVIAVHRPLSLQVHPVDFEARAGFNRENALGVPLEAPERSFKDTVGKFEMVVALEPFAAAVGFMPVRAQIAALRLVDHPLAQRMADALDGGDDGGNDGAAAADAMMPVASRTWDGRRRRVFRAFALAVTDGERRNGGVEVPWLSLLCRARGAARGGRITAVFDNAITAARAFPGDAAVLCLLMMNAVRLRPGESCVVPPGTVHAYIHGVAAEIMTNSDNVLRAGLTVKHKDIPNVLRNIVTAAGAPMPAAITHPISGDAVTYAPPALEEFSLTVGGVSDGSGRGPVRADAMVPARPRVVIALGDDVHVDTAHAGAMTLKRGQSVFVPAADGDAHIYMDAHTNDAGGGFLVASTGI